METTIQRLQQQTNSDIRMNTGEITEEIRAGKLSRGFKRKNAVNVSGFEALLLGGRVGERR
jgi:hypothetical protein